MHTRAQVRTLEALLHSARVDGADEREGRERLEAALTVLSADRSVEHQQLDGELERLNAELKCASYDREAAQVGV